MTISGQLGNNKLSPTLFQNKLTFWLFRVNLLSITSFEQTVSVPLCPKLQPSIKFNTQLQSFTIYSTTIRYILKYRIKLGNNKCYAFHGITCVLDKIKQPSFHLRHRHFILRDCFSNDCPYSAVQLVSWPRSSFMVKQRNQTGDPFTELNRALNANSSCCRCCIIVNPKCFRGRITL